MKEGSNPAERSNRMRAEYRPWYLAIGRTMVTMARALVMVVGMEIILYSLIAYQ